MFFYDVFREKEEQAHLLSEMLCLRLLKGHSSFSWHGSTRENRDPCRALRIVWQLKKNISEMEEQDLQNLCVFAKHSSYSLISLCLGSVAAFSLRPSILITLQY